MRRQPGFRYSLLTLLSFLVLLLAPLRGTPAYAGLEPNSARAGEVDLWLTATGDRSAAAPFDSVLLTVRCGNRGSALAASTTVTVSLPSGLGLIEAYPAATTQSNNMLTWDTGSFKPQSEPFTILVLAQVTLAATITQTALITAGIASLEEPDPYPDNNVARYPLYIGYRYNFPFIGHRLAVTRSF